MQASVRVQIGAKMVEMEQIQRWVQGGFLLFDDARTPSSHQSQAGQAPKNPSQIPSQFALPRFALSLRILGSHALPCPSLPFLAPPAVRPVGISHPPCWNGKYSVFCRFIIQAISGLLLSICRVFMSISKHE